MKRPDRLRIGCYDYKIDWVDGNWTASNNRYGETELYALVIRLNGTLPPARLAGCFVHEITHAMFDYYGYDHGGEKIELEQVATTIEHCLPILWRDNPEAFAWWMELVKGEAQTQ